MTAHDALEKPLRTALHLVTVGAPVGFIIGIAVAAYNYVVNALLWRGLETSLPIAALCMMPAIGMLLTGLILSRFQVKSSALADDVVRAYHQPEAGLNFASTLPKLAASITTMGFGASAGMEGASKWLGATIAAFIQKRLNQVPKLKWAHGAVETTLLAGAAAGIAAIFRAPLTGAIMGIESPYKSDLAHEALLHALVASAVSYSTITFLAPETAYFPISFHYALDIRDLLLCIPVGILAGLSANLFLGTLSTIRNKGTRLLGDGLLRFICGGLLLSAVSYGVYSLIGEPATLQAGLPVARRLLAGQYSLQVCLLIFAAKLLATAITFGLGGVGGLFLPSATIGAALGASCDLLFHPSQPGLFTLIGIAAFTGASYNGLLFSAVFVAEATGSAALVVPGLIASTTAFLVAAGGSNSPSQRRSRRPSTTT